MRMREIATVRVRYGYRKILVLLQREGWAVGKTMVSRLYREEGLTLRPTVPRKRRVAVERRERPKATGPNQVWSLDFVVDQLADGRRFRALTVVDVYTRESLAIEPGQSLKGKDVMRVLQSIQKDRGGPKTLFCDNGSEFSSQLLDLWAYQNGVKIDFSRPGKPTDNGHIESVFAGVVWCASFFRCDNQAPPLLSGGAARQEEYKRGGTQGYQLHGSFHP